MMCIIIRKQRKTTKGDKKLPYMQLLLVSHMLIGREKIVVACVLSQSLIRCCMWAICGVGNGAKKRLIQIKYG